MLEHFDLPALFFITTGGISSGREFWWDELEQLILGEGAPSEISFAAGDLVYSWNIKMGETIGPVGDSQSWWTAGDGAALRVYRSCHHVLQLRAGPQRGILFCVPSHHVPNLDGNEFEELLTAAFSEC